MVKRAAAIGGILVLSLAWLPTSASAASCTAPSNPSGDVGTVVSWTGWSCTGAQDLFTISLPWGSGYMVDAGAPTFTSTQMQGFLNNLAVVCVAPGTVRIVQSDGTNLTVANLVCDDPADGNAYPRAFVDGAVDAVVAGEVDATVLALPDVTIGGQPLDVVGTVETEVAVSDQLETTITYGLAFLVFFGAMSVVHLFFRRSR